MEPEEKNKPPHPHPHPQVVNLVAVELLTGLFSFFRLVHLFLTIKLISCAFCFLKKDFSARWSFFNPNSFLICRFVLPAASSFRFVAVDVFFSSRTAFPQEVSFLSFFPDPSFFTVVCWSLPAAEQKCAVSSFPKGQRKKSRLRRD